MCSLLFYHDNDVQIGCRATTGRSNGVISGADDGQTTSLARSTKRQWPVASLPETSAASEPLFTSPLGGSPWILSRHSQIGQGVQVWPYSPAPAASLAIIDTRL